MLKKRFFALLGVLFCALFVVGVLGGSAVAQERNIILTTTTSVQDSGLLDALVPVFEKNTGYIVKTISVGSGQAMAMAKRGEADVLLVHSPKAEEEFVNAGFGVNRRLVMYNYFVLVGPPEDPAKVNGMKSAKEAFENIAKTNSLFVSRGDNSGTHALEKKVWGLTGLVTDKQSWYQETGLGMGNTLSVANEKGGYTLTDKATYLSLKKKLRLIIVVHESKELYNAYSVIEINSEKFPKVNTAGAKAFADFLLSDEGQKIIAKYGVESFGEGLFFVKQ
ncbi:MAG: substrate-binding domain-containing protein [Deltaproteobacteria bacterium]|nr:substrate-binding domain-containing protein [Deltaproteobacteria bacterium]